MKPEIYENSNSGKLVKVWKTQPNYYAFVPNPLPPKIELTAKLILANSEADRSIGELAGLGRTIPNPNLFIRPFIQREAVLSSRIEGTQADLTDLYNLEVRQLSLFPDLEPSETKEDTQEVLNYVKALEYGIERVKTFPISKRLICELHERLMQGVRGEKAKPGQFRDVQNWIGAPNSKITEAEYIPPPVEDMNLALEQLEKYINENDLLPPLIRIALIHYQFEAIHPFIDGNGRIGRLLISLLLLNWSILPSSLLYLSAYFERNRNRYYDLLKAVSERGAWQEWLLFFWKVLRSKLWTLLLEPNSYKIYK